MSLIARWNPADEEPKLRCLRPASGRFQLYWAPWKWIVTAEKRTVSETVRQVQLRILRHAPRVIVGLPRWKSQAFGLHCARAVCPPCHQGHRCGFAPVDQSSGRDERTTAVRFRPNYVPRR